MRNAGKNKGFGLFTLEKVVCRYLVLTEKPIIWFQDSGFPSQGQVQRAYEHLDGSSKGAYDTVVGSAYPTSAGFHCKDIQHMVYECFIGSDFW